MYDRENDINRLFIEDSREKKRTAVGIHHRASRKGYIRGGIKTAYDFMTTKERKKLNGEVRIYSMFDKYKDLENCNLDEILRKSDSDIKSILTVIKGNNTCAKICAKFKVSNGGLYGIYKKYGVEHGTKPKRQDTKNIDLSQLLIAKERFDLMDGISKGKYLINFFEQYDTSMRKVAEYWGYNKNNISYYMHQYRKKFGNAVTYNEQKQIPAQPLQQQIDLLESENTQNESEEMNKKLLALEEMNKNLEENNKKLSEKLLEFTMNQNNNGSKFKIEFNGEYSKEELGNRLLSLDNLTIESKKYLIKMTIEEI